MATTKFDKQQIQPETQFNSYNITQITSFYATTNKVGLTEK